LGTIRIFDLTFTTPSTRLEGSLPTPPHSAALGRHERQPGRAVRRALKAAVASLFLLTVADSALPALAQAPFRVYDPFYRGETARRAFYDGYAFTAELSYRASGSILGGRQSLNPDPFGLSFRLDYQLAPLVDISAIIDAASSSAGRKLTLQWIAVKAYHKQEYTDYAVRLAVDPAFDGRVGFPQMDLAFLSTSLLAPNVSTDYALGVRRVRFGYERLRQTALELGDDLLMPVLMASDIVYTRALGWEAHIMMQYSVLLNPARSNAFVSLLVDVGQYDLIESSLREANLEVRASAIQNAKFSDGPEPSVTSGSGAREYRGGVISVRTGFEYNRPSYQLHPFVSLPVRQWMPDEGGPPARINVGVRLTLR